MVMKTVISALIGVSFLAACVSQPMGPSVAVMPAPNKPFDVFAQDQATCKDFADGQVAGGPNATNNQAIGTAAIGTALGAGLGAAVGEGRGAAVGAGTGAIAGTAIGSGQSERAQMSLQQRYDIAYSQCMYAKGNQVPSVQPPIAPPPPPPPNR
jgi:uncharacterized protein YcfJ